GLVVLARHPLTGVRVAIKLMKPEYACILEAVRRFLSEARHTHGLSHPNIVRLMEVSDRSAGPYYVMPYYERGSLAAALVRGGGGGAGSDAASRELTVAVASDVAAALA